MNRIKYQVTIENKGKGGSWFENYRIDAINKNVAVKLAKIDFKENAWNKGRRIEIVDVSEI